MKNFGGFDDSGSAIICGHVAINRCPILYAERSEPIDEIDSGWQFLCNASENEDVGQAQVWSINEVLCYEPSLKRFMNYPPGTRLERKNIESDWKIINN